MADRSACDLSVIAQHTGTLKLQTDSTLLSCVVIMFVTGANSWHATIHEYIVSGECMWGIGSQQEKEESTGQVLQDLAKQPESVLDPNRWYKILEASAITLKAPPEILPCAMLAVHSMQSTAKPGSLMPLQCLHTTMEGMHTSCAFELQTPVNNLLRTQLL